MATLCESNNWFRVYFTSVNNIARCDICNTSFKITKVQKDDIKNHVKTKHSVDYQRIVLSKDSQKHFVSQLYIKQNNDITCKFCNSVFNPTYYWYSFINHLKKKHEIIEDKAAKICEKLRNYYFDALDTDIKRKCTSCNETILNKPLPLMRHLSEFHKIDVLLEIRSVGFFACKNWVSEYFLRSEGQEAKCSVCNKPFLFAKNFTNIINHIKRKHGNNFDVSENSQRNKNWPYSIIENNQTKCNICDKIYDIVFCATFNMKTHLIEAHNLNEDIARKFCNWVIEYIHISNFQTSKCNICENMFQTSNCFKLMIHLKEAHQVLVSPEIIPARLSKSLQDLLNSNNDKNTSICSQQPTCSFDQSSSFDNDSPMDLSLKTNKISE